MEGYNIRRIQNATSKESICNIMSCDQMFNTYGYLMDEEHGNDIELLIDIMRLYGISVNKYADKYIVEE